MADKAYIYGHISSFFKQSERPSPIVDYRTKEYNQLNIEKVYPSLLKLDTNYFAIGLWATEDRSNYTWKNFITLAEKLQHDKPDISLVVYVRSPDYGKNKHFCWDEHVLNNTCTNETNYNDYILWAEKVSKLHSRFPIIKGILIDDFLYTISHDDSDGRLLSPGYLAQVRAKGREFDPDFTIDAVFYQKIISAYHAKRFENSLDGVLFFYRHFDTNGTRIDPNPNRVKEEIEMFNRSYRSNTSPLATIYRKPTVSSTKNDTLILQGTVNINNISTDIKIACWDNIYDTSVNGLTKIKLSVNNETILDQDIASGISDNSLQILTIPYSTLKNISTQNVTLRLEISTLKSYWRWSYLVNLFILSPENIPVNWNLIKDDDEAHVLTTSKELKGNTKRYLGIYAGAHSQFDVTTSYTKTLLKHALSSIKSNKLDGYIAWEVMMNKPNSGIFRAYNQQYIPNILIRKINDGRVYSFELDSNGKYSYYNFVSNLSDWSVVGRGDFDGDKVQDILLKNTLDHSVRRILLDIDGTIKDIADIADTPKGYSVVTINDFNGDGIDDLIFFNEKYPLVKAPFLLNQQGQHDDSQHEATGMYLGTYKNPYVVGSADFNNDGISDILVSNTDGDIYKLIVNKNGNISDPIPMATMSKDWKLEHVIDDFNDDGTSDLLVRRFDDKVYALYLDKNGKYIGNRYIGHLTDWEIKGSADFDSNGVSDIVLYRVTDGTMARVLLNTDGSIKDASKIATMSNNWWLEPF